MILFQVTVGLTASQSGTDAIQALVDGVVAGQANVTAGANTLTFALTWDELLDGDYPSALSFKFNGAGGNSLTFTSIAINGQSVALGTYLDHATINAGTQYGNITIGSPIRHFFGRQEPDVGDPTDIRNNPGNALNTDLARPGDTTAAVTIVPNQASPPAIEGSSGRDIIYGSDFADRVNAGDGDDSVAGNNGGDTLFGGNGNDMIAGGAGDDSIFGGAGDDLLFGNAGADLLQGQAGNNVINGGDGDDTLVGGANNDILFGGDDNDTITGGNGNDVMYGDAGDDLLSGGNGHDTGWGGDGDDLMAGGNGNDILYGEAGDDLLSGGAGNDILYGDDGTGTSADGDDAVMGGDGDDTIHGGLGNDIVYGEAGDDKIYGEDGEDVLSGGAGTDTLDGGAGNDIIYATSIDTATATTLVNSSNHPDISFGMLGNSFYKIVQGSFDYATAAAAAAASTLNGVAGHLVVVTSAAEQSELNELISDVGINSGKFWMGGSDTSLFGEGAWLWNYAPEATQQFSNNSGTAFNGLFTYWQGGAPADVTHLEDYAALDAGNSGYWTANPSTSTFGYIIEWDGASFSTDTGADLLTGGDGDDTLYGGNAGSTFDGGAGNDRMYGGAGNDVFKGGAGVDYITGGGGSDTYDASDATGSVVTTNFAGSGIMVATSDGYGSSNELLLGVSNFTGGAYADTIESSAGNSVLIGGGGTDLLTYANATAGVTVNLATTAAQATGGSGSDTVSGFENLNGSAFNDVLTGDANGNVIQGGNGDDTIDGGNSTAVDTLDGGGGTDTISYASLTGGSGVTVNLALMTASGGGGADSIAAFENITGSSYADVLNGSTSANVIQGGNGDDTIYGWTGADTIDGGAGNDTISLANGDFASGESIAGGAGTDVIALGFATTVDFTTGALSGIETLTGSTGNDAVTVLATDYATMFSSVNLGSGTVDQVFVKVSGAVDVSAATVATLSGVEYGHLRGTTGADTLTITGAQLDALLLGAAASIIMDTGTDTLNITTNSARLSQLGAAGDTVIQGLEAISAAAATAAVTVNLSGQSDGFTVTGGSDADTLTGSTGNDTINGGNGNDTIEGGLGNDVLSGGGGTDLLTYATATAGVTVNLATTTAQNTGAAGTDTVSGFENLTGSAGNDTLTGDAGANTIDGGAGNDTINLANGDFAAGESIAGGAGTDSIVLTNAATVDFTTGSLSGLETLTGSGGDDNVVILATHYAGMFSGINLGAGTNTLTTVASGTVDISATAGATLSNINTAHLSGSAGNDTITLTGAQFNALLLGLFSIVDLGAGTDTINLTSDSTRLDTLGQNGWDLIRNVEVISAASSSNAVTIRMTAQTEALTIVGSAFNDTIYGGAGNDTISGGAGNDLLTAGAGTDTLTYVTATAGVVVSLANAGTPQNTGGAGTDTISNFENLTGSAYADSLIGDGGDNVFIGGAGSDVYTGGAGNDTLDYSLDPGGVVVTMNYLGLGYGLGLDGWSSLEQYSSIENVTGSAYNDTIYGDSGANVIDGGAGNDTIDGGLGNDTLTGGSGTDTLTYAGGNGGGTLTTGVTVSLATTTAQNTGGAGTDTISGFENLIGTAFNDTLTGDSGNNSINGGAGDDTICGGLGGDVLTGGTGTDTVSYASATAGVIVNLATGAALDEGGAIDLISTVENVTGSAYNDTLTGDGNNNTIDGGLGNDVLNGGAGTDTLSYASATAAVTLNLGTTTAQNTGGAGTDTVSAFENLMGSAFHDTLTGDGGSNTIDGGTAGNDVLAGGAGTDTLSYASATAGVTVYLAITTAQNTVGSGTDTISGFENVTGSAFNDSIVGDNGDNVINGGAGGDDKLYGAAGNDTLYSGSADALTALVNTILAANSSVSYDATTGNFYQLVNSTSSFAAAVTASDAARLTGDGTSTHGHIAMPYTTYENSLLDTFPGLGTNQIWLGATDGVTEGTFLISGGSMNGVTLWIGTSGGAAQNGLWTNWKPGQPDNASNADFIGQNDGGEWEDRDGSTGRRYVIEWDGSQVFASLGSATLHGGAGSDILYGSGGSDVFLFLSADSATTNPDTIYNFDYNTGTSTFEQQHDKLDLKDLLTGYVAGTSDPDAFVQFVASGNDLLVKVDANGTTGGASFSTIATLVNANTADTGYFNVEHMVHDGYLILA